MHTHVYLLYILCTSGISARARNNLPIKYICIIRERVHMYIMYKSSV